jgi:hypothetical protein
VCCRRGHRAATGAAAVIRQRGHGAASGAAAVHRWRHGGRMRRSCGRRCRDDQDMVQLWEKGVEEGMVEKELGRG